MFNIIHVVCCTTAILPVTDQNNIFIDEPSHGPPTIRKYNISFEGNVTGPAFLLASAGPYVGAFSTVSE
jgi:hypothetical protein